MAVSQNDPKNWPHDVSLYDPEKRGKTLNRTVFQWITVTIDRVWPGDSYGLKFMDNPPCTPCEDKENKCDQGAIWNIFGTWNDAIGRSDPYAGTQYVAGQKVDVQLQLSEKQQADGSTKYQRSIPKIRMNDEYSRVSAPAAEAPAETPAAPQQEPAQEAEPVLTIDQRIAKAQAINIIKDLLIAGVTTEIGLTEKAGWVILRDEVARLAQGKAVDLSYLSPLVAAAIENGGTVTEVKDSNNPDEEVEELKW